MIQQEWDIVELTYLEADAPNVILIGKTVKVIYLFSSSSTWTRLIHCFTMGRRVALLLPGTVNLYLASFVWDTWGAKAEDAGILQRQTGQALSSAAKHSLSHGAIDYAREGVGKGLKRTRARVKPSSHTYTHTHTHTQRNTHTKHTHTQTHIVFAWNPEHLYS